MTSKIPNGLRVEVYWNLRKELYSVRALQDHGEHIKKGRVIGHQSFVRLDNAKFVVQPAGLARVRREGVKNVHAFIRGTWEAGPMAAGPHHPDQQVSYNPYKAGNFVMRSTGEPVTEADSVTLTHTGQAYIG